MRITLLISWTGNADALMNTRGYVRAAEECT